MANPSINISMTEPINRPVIHYIRPGDTLGKIAKRYGVSVNELARINGIRNVHSIPRSRYLIIRRPQSGPTIDEIINGDNQSSLNIKFYRYPFSLPLAGNRITSFFGNRRNVIGTRRRNSFHAGLDLSAPLGTSIPAANDGKVIHVGPSNGYGNTVVIAHGHGKQKYYTVYAHLNEISVVKDQLIERGTIIGTVGNSGYSTGPHLHFEVRNHKGIALNPLRIANLPLNIDRGIIAEHNEEPQEPIYVDDMRQKYLPESQDSIHPYSIDIPLS